MPQFKYAGNWRGVIPNRIRRHQESVRMSMSRVAAAYLAELEDILRRASIYLTNNADSVLEQEIMTGRRYLNTNK